MAGECVLRYQLDEVSPEILDPINWAIAGFVGLIVVLAAWYLGWSLLATAFLVAVAFLSTFLWLVTDDRDDAWVSERQADKATPDALASVYAIKLRQIGINAAILGANGLFIIQTVVKANWGMLGLLAFGFAGTVVYLYISRREVLGGAIRKAWTHHVIVMSVLGVIAAVSGLAAVRAVSVVGKAWPKVLAFGVNPRSMAVGYIFLAIAGLVWFINQQLAQRAASGAAEDDLHDAPTIGSFERAPRARRNAARARA